MPRYSDTVAISSARRRRWPLRRSVTAEGDRPRALARPLRVLPVLLRPERIQSTVKAEAPATCFLQVKGVGRSGASRPLMTRQLTVLTSFPKNRNSKKQNLDTCFCFPDTEQNKNITRQNRKGKIHDHLPASPAPSSKSRHRASGGHTLFRPASQGLAARSQGAPGGRSSQRPRDSEVRPSHPRTVLLHLAGGAMRGTRGADQSCDAPP